MAKRRSMNRRWSRRSINATELDQDSERIDEDNPMWWKNLPDASTLRPSAQTSFAETTVPNLTTNSLVNDSELQDRWWDNLDRTSLQSSRRFSVRKSINPEEVALESFVSEGDDEVSIKKRKVLLRARSKQSGGTENFLKAFDDSDVARSEPLPRKKRKSQSPAGSDADAIQRKIRTRHSRSLADAEHGDTSMNTSNDTDIVIKARPKPFKKRATQISSEVYDEILANAGPSGVNTSRNASRINTPEKTIDSNESGFMGPPITGSHRKRLSTISKKLDMTSDESEGYAGTNKSRRGFRIKSKANASVNPFDEILSGQLNESTASVDAANKSVGSSNATARMSKSSEPNLSLRVSMRGDEDQEPKEVSASESQLRDTDRTVNEKTLNVEEKGKLQERDRRSSSELKEDSRVSLRHRRNEKGEEEATINEWDVPETQEDPGDVAKLTKNSTMIEESLVVEDLPESQDGDRRSFSALKQNDRHSKRRTRDATIGEDATNEWNVPETQDDSRISIRRIKNSTMIEESAEIEKLPESPDRVHRSSSVLKKQLGDSKRHTKDASGEWNVPETQEDSRISIRRIKNSTMIEESAKIDKLPESPDRVHRSSSVLKKQSGDSKRHTKDASGEWNVPETQEDSRKLARSMNNATMIEESVEIDKPQESQDKDRRSSSVLKKHLEVSKRRTEDATIEKTGTSEWESQEVSRISTKRMKKSMIIEESVAIDKLPESQEIDRRSSSVLKGNSRISKRHTRDATIEELAAGEWEVPETQEDSRLSIRPAKNSTMIGESMEIDKLPESQEIDRRSSSVLKGNSRISKRNTRDAAIEEAAVGEWEVPETQQDSRLSIRPAKNSTMIGESMEIDKLPESQEIDRRSSSVLKGNSRLSKRRTRDATIEEAAAGEWGVPETQEDSRLSIRPAKNSTMIGESMEIDKLPESQKIDRRSSSVLKENSRLSKRRTRDANIEEAAASEWQVPETQEDSRLSIRPVKNSTMIEESSSVSMKNLRDTKKRTKEATIDEATLEDDELPTFDGKSAKLTSTLKENTRDSKRRTVSMGQKMKAAEHSALAEKTQSHLFEGWETSGSEEEDKVIKPHEQSHNDSHNSSLIKKTLAVSINRLSSKEISHSRQAKELKEVSAAEEDKIPHVKSRSLRSHSRNLVDTAYELPDKERSPSPIMSASENESINKNVSLNTSARQSSKNQRENSRSARESVNRSISDPRLNTSRRIPADPVASVSRVDSAADLDESDLKGVPKDSTKSRKDLFVDNKTMSTKGIRNTSANQEEDSNQSISEELAIGSQKSNLSLSRKSSRVERKANDTERSASRQDGHFDESINEKEAHQSHKSNLTSSRKSSRSEKQIEPRKSAAPTNTSDQNPNFAESISDAETEIADKETPETNQRNLRTENRSSKPRKSSTRPNVSGKREESGESISEVESNSESLNQPPKDKSGASRINSERLKFSRQRIESDESISEEESILKSVNQPPKNKNSAGRKNPPHHNVSKQHLESHESGTKEDAEDLENLNPTLDKSANRSNHRPVDISRRQTATNRNASSNVENIEEDTSTSIPSEGIPVAPAITKLPQNTSSFLGKSNRARAQKNITDFFPSKFLQRNDNSKTLDSFTSFDKEKLDLVKKEVEIKRRQMAALRIEELSKKKENPTGRRPENALKVIKLRANKNTPKQPAKPPKVVDKAYIVNGQVYKRPKLPRPKPWVTDRLYRHLWKCLEPKYNMRTRIKSEHFVEQLSEVVALTIRRKKYDSYKAEVDALMKEMARLNIIKTRNDFYDFCYDYLPYDFRVKVTPMLLPGNIQNIPYDPATLHTPIISER